MIGMALKAIFGGAARLGTGLAVKAPMTTVVGGTLAADALTGKELGTSAGQIVNQVGPAAVDAAGTFATTAVGAGGTFLNTAVGANTGPQTGVTTGPDGSPQFSLTNTDNTETSQLAGFMKNMAQVVGDNPAAMLGAAIGAFSGDGMMGRFIGLIVGAVLGGVVGKFIGIGMNNDGPQSGTAAQFNPAAFGLPAGPAPAALQADIEQQPKPAPLAFTPAG